MESEELLLQSIAVLPPRGWSSSGSLAFCVLVQLMYEQLCNSDRINLAKHSYAAIMRLR